MKRKDRISSDHDCEFPAKDGAWLLLLFRYARPAGVLGLWGEWVGDGGRMRGHALNLHGNLKSGMEPAATSCLAALDFKPGAWLSTGAPQVQSRSKAERWPFGFGHLQVDGWCCTSPTLLPLYLWQSRGSSLLLSLHPSPPSQKRVCRPACVHVKAGVKRDS